MNGIKISTLTPCFRMKKYLKEFLEILPEQTLFNQLEIVIDHNEPDEDEVGWVSQFQNKYPDRIRYNIVKTVDPYGQSINRCLKMSNGPFIAFWNIDDLRSTNSLELQLKTLEAQDADIAYGNYVKVKHFGQKDGQTIDVSSINHRDFLSEYHFGPFFMFRKKIIEKIGIFDEQFRCAADFDFAVRAARSFKCAFVEGNLGYYLNAAEGLSTKPDSVQQIERTVVELRYGGYAKLDFSLIPRASEYSIPYLYFDHDFHHVRHFFPNYYKFIRHDAPKKFQLASEKFERQKRKQKRKRFRQKIRSLFKLKN